MKKITSEIPALPSKIVDAINNETFAIFIGAGVSRLANCWSWKKLAEECISLCLKEKLINYSEKEVLDRYDDNRKTITIVFEKLRAAGLETEFYLLMQDALKGSEPKTEIFHDIVIRLRPVVVTTNADNLLNEFYDPHRIVFKDFKPEKIDRTKLYKLHGTIDEKESLVFRLPEYFKTYQNVEFIKFLQNLFDEYTVLFIGYGLAEFELLEFLFSKGASYEKKDLRHFILLDFFEGEEAKLDLEKLYYNHLGIDIIDYCKNNNGYREQENIIKDWADRINISSSIISNDLKSIDFCFENPNQLNIDKAMQLIKTPQAAEYFWQNIPVKDTKGLFLSTLISKGYFNPTKQPSTFEDPVGSGKQYIKQWLPLNYLEIVLTSSKSNAKIKEKALALLNSIVKYIVSEGNSNRLTDWKISEIIFRLPLEKITTKHFSYINNVALFSENSLVSHAFEDFVIQKVLTQKSNLHIFESISKIVFRANNYDEHNTIDNYHLDNIAKAISENLTPKRIAFLAEFLIKIIKKRHQKEAYKLSVYEINTLEDENESLGHYDFDNILVRLLRDVLLKKSKQNLLKVIHNDLLKINVPILKRILFYIIDNRYNEFKNILWNWESNPLNIEGAKHELYELLKRHCKSFNIKESDKILNWIDHVTIKKYDGITEAEHKTYTASLKREWLTALDNDEFIKKEQASLLSDKYKLISNHEISHPGYYVYTSWSDGREKSDITNPIWNESNSKISEFIIGKGNWNGYNESGIIDELKSTLKKNPKNRTSKLTEFNNIPLTFKSNIIYILSDLAKESTDINLEEISNFINEIIFKNTFWNQSEDAINNFYRCFSWFTKEIFNNDSFDLTPILINQYEKFIIEGLRKIKSDLKVNNRYNKPDYLNNVYNSVKGIMYQTWLEINLRNGRNEDSILDNKWLKSSFSFINELIEIKDPEPELLYFTNGCLAQLFYLNTEWTRNNMSKICPYSNDNFWEYGFTTYLFFSRSIDIDVYNIFKNGRYFDKAITYYVDKSNYTDKLVQQIIVMYNSSIELLNEKESLINKLLNNHSAIQYEYIIKFYLRLQDKTDNIRALWNILIKFSGDFTIQEKNNLHLSLLNWLQLIPEIDDQIFDWIKLSIDNVLNRTDYRFLKILHDRAHENIELTGKIFVYLIEKDKETKFTPNQQLDFIRRLYENKFNDLADSACRLFMNKGDFFVRNLYENFNGKNINVID